MVIAARSQQAPADRLAQLRSLALEDGDRSTPAATTAGTSRRASLQTLSLAFVAGGVIATAACFAFVDPATVPAPTPARERVSDLRAAPDRQSAIVATGYVVARRQATVAVEMVGRITSLPVQEGQFVKRGAVLATLDASLARADSNAQEYDRQASLEAITAIEAQLENAVVVRQRAESLRAKGFATDASLTAALAQERALRAQAAQARSTLQAKRARDASARTGGQICRPQAANDCPLHPARPADGTGPARPSDRQSGSDVRPGRAVRPASFRSRM